MHGYPVFITICAMLVYAVCGKQKISDTTGFSLVEVLVSTTLLILGILALTSIFTMSRQTNRLSENKTDAYTIAELVMEDAIMLCQQSAVPPGTYPVDGPQTFPEYPQYLWQYTIRNDVDARAPNGAALLDPLFTRQIVVDVFWPANMPEHKRNSITLQSIATQIYNRK